MKKLSTVLTGAALSLALLGPAQSEVLTVVSFGGAYGAAQEKHMIAPFVAKNRSSNPV